MVFIFILNDGHHIFHKDQLFISGDHEDLDFGVGCGNFRFSMFAEGAHIFFRIQLDAEEFQALQGFLPDEAGVRQHLR